MNSYTPTGYTSEFVLAYWALPGLFRSQQGNSSGTEMEFGYLIGDIYCARAPSSSAHLPHPTMAAGKTLN